MIFIAYLNDTMDSKIKYILLSWIVKLSMTMRYFVVLLSFWRIV